MCIVYGGKNHLLTLFKAKIMLELIEPFIIHIDFASKKFVGVVYKEKYRLEDFFLIVLNSKIRFWVFKNTFSMFFLRLKALIELFVIKKYVSI